MLFLDLDHFINMSVCSHYIRRCALVTPCCEKTYPCRFCHDKEENHELDRSSVEFIKCTQCSTIQEVGLHCTECGIRFGMYACLGVDYLMIKTKNNFIATNVEYVVSVDRKTSFIVTTVKFA